MSLQTRIDQLEELLFPLRNSLREGKPASSHENRMALLGIGDEMLTLLRERRQEEIEDLLGSRG